MDTQTTADTVMDVASGKEDVCKPVKVQEDSFDCDVILGNGFKIPSAQEFSQPLLKQLKEPTMCNIATALDYSLAEQQRAKGNYMFVRRKRRGYPYAASTKFLRRTTGNGDEAVAINKTPLSLLYEIKPKLKTVVTGTEHGKFMAVINGSDVSFCGFGSTKKDAKHNAAIQALQSYNPCALASILQGWKEKQKIAKDAKKTAAGGEVPVIPVSFTNPPDTSEIDFASDDGWSKQVQPIISEVKFTKHPLISLMEITASPPPKRKRKILQATKSRGGKSDTDIADKNPLMLLNEMLPGTPKCFVCVEEKGINGSPMFKMQLNIQEDSYVGEGKSKKRARLVAAIQALRKKFAMDHPSWEAMLVEPTIKPKPTAATADETENMDTCDGEGIPTKISATTRLFGKNPVMLLNEKIPKLHYSLKAECGKYDSNSFVMEVDVNGVQYQGFGKSKKQAKVGAAITALREQFGIEASYTDTSKRTTSDQEDEDHGGLPDLIHNLVREKFSQLTDNMQSPNAKHKVLAGIVMTRTMDKDVTEGEVIAISTGTKCINGSFISNQGTVLLDCHAEIVCRRGLMKYLYHQLLNYNKDDVTSIIESCDGGKGFQLKSDVFFHLYINTTPCGDARIFSLREDEQHIDDHPNRKSRGQLRTKVEVGQGTIPAETESLVLEKNRFNVQQTWDAVIGGERLLTMSCSDKISKWNVLGAQGALLSIYLESVRFNSIIIGSLYHSEHVRRGLFERAKLAVDVVQSTTTEPQISVTKPILASVSNPPKREVSGKAPLSCLQWNAVDQTIVMVNASTGQVDNSTPSELCKRGLLKLFLQLMGKKEMIPRVEIGESADAPLTYQEWKGKATDYQDKKNLLMKGLEGAGYGSWVGKPSEVEQFILSASEQLPTPSST